MSYPVHPFTVIESVHGRFIVNRHCDWQIDYLAKTGATHIEHEIAMLVTIANTLSENCVIVDAGANIGLISVPLASAVKARGGAVHAFEVQRPLYMALCGTVVLNDLSNLLPYNEGLGVISQVCRLPYVDYGKRADFGLVSVPDTVPDGPQGDLVLIRRLEDHFLPRLDLLKIDVEGMEFAVLAGAGGALVEYRPWCWVEYWKSDIAALKSAFDGLDYVFYRMDDLNMLCAPRDRLEKSGITIQASEM